MGPDNLAIIGPQTRPYLRGCRLNDDAKVNSFCSGKENSGRYNKGAVKAGVALYTSMHSSMHAQTAIMVLEPLKWKSANKKIYVFCTCG